MQNAHSEQKKSNFIKVKASFSHTQILNRFANFVCNVSDSQHYGQMTVVVINNIAADVNSTH